MNHQIINKIKLLGNNIINFIIIIKKISFYIKFLSNNLIYYINYIFYKQVLNHFKSSV